MSDGEAYRRARVEIGGVEQVKERSRDVRPLRWARDAMQDVRYGLRGLRKTPRFTIAAVLTVVLGVGANATIFSVLNPLLFKPLPYPEPDRIVNVFRTSPQSDRWPHSMANYLDHRARNTVFEHLAALTWEDASFADPGQPAERLFALRTTGNFFALFGVAPLMGRAFTDADDQTGAEPVVVLSYGLWQRRFNGDRGDCRTLDAARRPQGDRHRRDAARLRLSAVLGKHRSVASVRGVSGAATEPREQLSARVRASQAGRHARSGGRGHEGHCQTDPRREHESRSARERPHRVAQHRQPGDAPHLGVCVRPDLPRAAHRLREPGQPAAGADGGAGARVRDSRRHWRRQGTAPQAVADRQPGAVVRRRIDRDSALVLVHAAHRQPAVRGPAGRSHHAGTGHAGLRVRMRGAHRPDLRRRAGVARVARRHQRRAEAEPAEHDGWPRTAAFPAGTHRRRDRLRADHPGRRGVSRARAAADHRGRSRLAR